MDYFPAFLQLGGKPCLLVGGGEVAARKARLLVAANARLTAVAPEIGPTLAATAAAADAELLQRAFRPADLEGKWLVVCATDDAEVQKQVARAAERAGIFCNSVDDVANSSYITPAIVDRSPVVVAISSGGAAPVLARRLRERIEALLPAGIGQLADLARRWRERVSARVADALRRRRFWEAFFDGPVASAVYANRPDLAETAVASLLDETTGASGNEGEAWLVGAGPGDPGLLTLRALQVMQSADVILHDRLVTADILALARRDAELIAVGKAPGCKQTSQASINEMLIGLVAAGKRVCRLKGGDPFIFGRGGEEVEALTAAGLRCQIVPGITAAAGCAAAGAIPLTHRDMAQAVVLLTAHGKDSVDRLDWPSLARDRQTLAVYMAVRRFRELMQNLIAHGRPPRTPVAVIENGTTPQQRIIRGSLGQLPLLAAAHRIESPAMLLIGEVAAIGAEVPAAARHDLNATESVLKKTANLR